MGWAADSEAAAGDPTEYPTVLDRIWAPWRAQYVSREARDAESAPPCFLCAALAQSDDHDQENLIVWRGDDSVVMLNRYPYNNGHLLVAPKTHQGALGDLQGASLIEPIQVVRWMTLILDRVLRPQGYNIGLNQGGAAGAGLPGHLHWHIVPRWSGDVNFMPILAGAKVVTESLSAFHDRLGREIAADLEAGRGV